MTSIINAIKKIRNNDSMVVDLNNKNRYRLVLNENNGTKTAYYFNTPIYNNATRKLLDLKFVKENGKIVLTGSNSRIVVDSGVTLYNGTEFCHISLPSSVTNYSQTKISCGSVEVYPTLNGVAVKIPTEELYAYRFNIAVNRPFLNIRANDKYFSYMSAEFSPFVTVSCIGSLDGDSKLVAPCTLQYQKEDDYSSNLLLTPENKNSKYILFEINLHEQKMIRDTTVESNNPHINNVFGGTAFIGNTKLFGEQRLYWCIDSAHMSDLLYKRIHSVVLHIPAHTSNPVDLDVFKISSRFCSFGSTWNNKIPETDISYNETVDKNYYHIDITDLTTNRDMGWWKKSDGLMIKSKKKSHGFTAVSTGDSYYSPQILEINFN